MQIKFRGKCIYNHDYVYGYAVKDKRSTTNWYIVTEDEEEYVEVEANSIAQFTGVNYFGEPCGRDNAIEIYSNDRFTGDYLFQGRELLPINMNIEFNFGKYLVNCIIDEGYSKNVDIENIMSGDCFQRDFRITNIKLI
jgi:hypothetical protein